MATPTATQCAPVAIIMFNRPELTRAVAERVAAANPSLVYLIADGPRPDNPDDRAACEATREAVLSIDWPCPVHTVFADTNMGLRERVSSGLDAVFDEVEQAIIVEDDCLADLSFFPYATELLERYRDEEQVGVISGNNFLRGRRMSEDSYFFSADMRIWGWATWGRVWKDFSREGLRHEWSPEEAKRAVSRLSSSGRRRALLADAERAHKINSWALPFVLHAQRLGYVSVVPEKNLVSNIGFGASSTHTKFESFTAEVPSEAISFPLRHPKSIKENTHAGVIEARMSRWQWVVFPVSHPIEFLSRVFRYLRIIFSKR
jgi:hypothetical protein